MTSKHTLAQFTVSGYVRQHQKETKGFQQYNHKLFQNIPPLVTSIVFGYYFMNGYFEIAGYGVGISENGWSIAICHGDWNNSTYSVPILSTLKRICTWKFKIHGGSGLMIGISSSIQTDQQFIKGSKGVRYGYCGWNGNKLDSDHEWSDSYGDSYTKGDTLTVQLDLINGKITFYKNGKSQGVAYENIQQDVNTEYRLAISMGDRNSNIEMTNYDERFQ